MNQSAVGLVDMLSAFLRARCLTGIAISWLLFGLLHTEAGSDLLDPARIGSRSTPSAPFPSPRSPGAAIIPAGGGSGLQPSYARNMAGTVVSKIDLLTARGVSLLDDRAGLLAKLHDLDAKRQVLIRDKESELEDYRKGLFCSGCGKTKHYIESRGETFPHAGYKMYTPTPAMVEAKDRELQRPVDLMTEEMTQVEKRIKEVKAAIDEVMDQIDVGIQLWSVAAKFEVRLVHRLELEDLAATRVARAKIDIRISDLNAEIFRAENAQPRDPRRIAAAIEERKPWDEAMARLDQERTIRRREHGDMLMRAELTARDEASRINGFASRGALGLHLSPMAVASVNDLSIGGLNRAEFFRMGDATPSRNGETVPSVDEFIRHFKGTSTERSPTLEQPVRSPAVAPEPVDRTRKSLKDLLEPGPADKANPKTGNPGGVRG